MSTQQAHLKSNQVITPNELLAHWQGHRKLTRKLIEIYPEEHFFKYSIGGMRTFAQMTMELLAIAGPGLKEIVTGQTQELQEHFDHQNNKNFLLKLWDEATVEIDTFFVQIALDRFSNSVKTFGQYEGTVISSILYFIDNEIHHRGQAYVYLRSLGIEPPFFWER